MAFPMMGLCPDSKRGLNLYLLRKNQDSSMVDKGGVAVFSTNSGCPPSAVDPRVSKYPSFFPQSASFSKSKLIPSFDFCQPKVVGGFLGSKSQLRQGNHPQRVWDLVAELVPNLFDAAAECVKKHCEINSVPSPPKKKFAKEEGPFDVTVEESVQVPSVIQDNTRIENLLEGSKQSYAEVAKSASSNKTRKSDHSLSPANLNGIKLNKNSGSHRRNLPSDSRKSRRKHNRREKAVPRTPVGECSLSLEPQTNCKDLRLDQRVRRSNQMKNTNSGGSKKLDRCMADNNHHLPIDLVSHNHSTRQSELLSLRGKRSPRANNFNCDIDKINWRTGEPIGSKMGSQCLSKTVEDFPSDKTFCERISMEPSAVVIVGRHREFSDDQRNSELSPSQPDLQSSPTSCQRHSLLSECSMDSEDSFIVFESGSVSDDSSSDLEYDLSDYSDDSYEDDPDAFEEDYRYETANLKLQEVNDLWEKEYSTPHSSSSLDQHFIGEEKKVRFSSSKPVIHRMLTWDYAYRSSRPGPWEQMARDRDRFSSRIRQFEGIISPVLAPEHRSKIWSRLLQERLS